MTLDLDQVASQLTVARERLSERGRQRSKAADEAFRLLCEDDVEKIRQKITLAGKLLRLPVPRIVDGLASRHIVGPPPADYRAIAADGSLIDVDRHSPLPCYLLNVGWVDLVYGAEPSCQIDVAASLFVDDDDLFMVNPDDGVGIRRVDGQLLGVEQGIRELERLAWLLATTPRDLPTVALVDGPLVVWGLTDPRVKGLIRARRGGDAPQSMFERYESALGDLSRVAADRQTAVAGYVSYPGYDRVANLVRVASCPHDVADCSKYCQTRSAVRGRDCDQAGTIDRVLFNRLLERGERSALFQAAAGEDSPALDIQFCYFQTGDEIARIEIPGWVAADSERLDLTMSVIADQVARGQGYPVALSEAHERAVLGSADRAGFWRLVGDTLSDSAVVGKGSAKAASKRVRGV